MNNKNVNYQIKWLDQRNANDDYSSKWKRIPTEKARQMIARYEAPPNLDGALRSIRSGREWKEKKFSIRVDPACVAPVIAVSEPGADKMVAIKSITSGGIKAGDVFTITGEGSVTVRHGQITGAKIWPTGASGSSYASGVITTTRDPELMAAAVEKFKQELIAKQNAINFEFKCRYHA